MLSLGNCLKLTKAYSLKTADAVRMVDGDSFVDGCIPPVYVNSTGTGPQKMLIGHVDHKERQMLAHCV